MSNKKVIFRIKKNEKYFCQETLLACFHRL
nr:MAG TPA: hypothetical protein [Caudoviricetes sp.]